MSNPVIPMISEYPIHYAKPGDAGADLYAASTVTLRRGESKFVHTNLRIAIPEGYVGLVIIRSSVGIKGIVIANQVGVIDSGYRGEVGVTVQYLGTTPFDDNMGGENNDKNEDGAEGHEGIDEVVIERGQRFAQLLIMPVAHAVFEDVVELPESERGEGGYGSTGKN